METRETGQTGELPARPAGSAAGGSVHEVTDRLEQVLAAAPDLDPWYVALRTAAEAALLAVGREIEAIEEPGGIHDEIAAEQPRMIPHLRKLEATLHGLVERLVETKECGPRWHNDTIASVRNITTTLRRAEVREHDIIHEAYVSEGANT